MQFFFDNYSDCFELFIDICLFFRYMLKRNFFRALRIENITQDSSQVVFNKNLKKCLLDSQNLLF